MATPPPAAHPRRYPRTRRLDGFIMNSQTLVKWACLLSGEPLNPELNTGTAMGRVARRVEAFGAQLKPVGPGETFPELEWMVVTRISRFDGWSDMDPALIPPLEEGEREEEVRRLLQEEGRFSENRLQCTKFVLSPSEFALGTDLYS